MEDITSLILKDFDKVTDEKTCDYPVSSCIRYVLWYSDEDSKKVVRLTTHDFDDVKMDVGTFAVIKFKEGDCIGSLYFVDVETIIPPDNKWSIVLTYTLFEGKRVITYTRNFLGGFK